MDILITHVYDKLRFAWYLNLKLNNHLSYAKEVANSINPDWPLRINDLPECDVRYLQRRHLEYAEPFVAIHPPICDLKILSNEKQSKPMSTVDITPSSNDDRPQESSCELYSVTYTKVIENKEALNIHQITALLNNPNVKSINIKK